MTERKYTGKPEISRRAALRGIGLIAAVSGGIMGVAAANETDQSVEKLKALIADHSVAARVEYEKWGDVGTVEDSEAMREKPKCRVQVGKLLIGGKDEEGKDLFNPIYAYSDDEIERDVKRNLDLALHHFCHNEVSRQKHTQNAEGRLARLMGEMAALRDECSKIEDACGYTATLNIAKAAAQDRRAIEEAIIAFKPQSLAAAAHLARWAIEATQNDFLDIGEEGLTSVLSSIGRAV